jgi:hypothetical protein
MEVEVIIEVALLFHPIEKSDPWDVPVEPHYLSTGISAFLKPIRIDVASRRILRRDEDGTEKRVIAHRRTPRGTSD